MTELSCSEVEQEATEYALGILPPEERRAVKAHLLSCRSCRDQVEEIREVGDRLVDLLPDAEPPLGLDHRILEHLAGAPPGRRRRLLPVVAAAAAIIVAALTFAAVEVTGGHGSHPAELTATVHEAARDVGVIDVGGNPAWLTMTIRHLDATGTVTCQLVRRDGTTLTVGAFQIVNGSGSWGAPVPAGATQLAGARIVSSSGIPIASASFGSNG